MNAIEARAERHANNECGQNKEQWGFCKYDYMTGATEQRKIDIDEACEIFCDTCPDAECTEHCAKYKYFRKAMENLI